MYILDPHYLEADLIMISWKSVIDSKKVDCVCALKGADISQN